MEEDDKNKVQKMISSTTDQKDDVAMNEAGGAKMEKDHKNKAAAKMISSTTEHHQKEGDAVTMKLDSFLNMRSKKRKEGPSETETTSAENSSKKRKGCPSGSYSRGKLTLHLNAGKAALNTPNGPSTREGEFQILSLFGSCLVGDDGRHHRKNAMCSVMLTDDKGKTSGNTSVNAFIAAGPVDIIAATFKQGVAKGPMKEKKSTGESSAAAAAQDGGSDSKKVIKEEASRMLVEGQTSRILQKTPPDADGT